jgi:histidyl-tRNA synthetase
MPMQFDPPSGTRDFLAAEVEARDRAFTTIRSVFSRYGFEPLQTPAFERLDVLLDKYGEEGDKLIFKILRRGEHEASGEADLALRYDLTVPLARVAAAYGSQLPTPYKRYAIGPVWRADRPGKGRYREFIQCDLDTLGSTSAMADAEVICAVHDALAELGVSGFRCLLNSRHVLAGLLEAFGVPADLGPAVLIILDKLDKLAPGEVAAELAGRGLDQARAAELVAAMTAPDATQRIRTALKPSEEGSAGLDEVDTLLSLVAGQVPAERVEFTPRLVRGLSYYTGPIWEVVAEGVAGSIAGGGRYDHLIEQLGGPDVPATGGSLGTERILMLLPDDGTDRHSRLDVAVTVISPEYASRSFALATVARSAGLRASVYLGSSGKLGRQLKWASDQGARWTLIYGRAEQDAGTVTVRDMNSGEQVSVPGPDLAGDMARRAAGDGR